MKSLFDILFPPICAACGSDTKHRELLCSSCKEKLYPEPLLQCSVCRGRVPFFASRQERCHPNASHLIFSASEYANPVVRSLIWHFKFKSRKKAGGLLSAILFEAISDVGYNLEETILVPIPLFPKRLRERGFNQAEKIADYLSDKLNLKKVSCLLRVKNTTPQSEISDYKQRRVNIAHAFEVRHGSGPFNKRIFLIDDVWTSGATMSEAVSVLKNAGAGEIIAMVVARAH